jgi:hypothetical protein
MCNGFGAIVTAQDVFFSEPDRDGDVSHSEILRRLGWQDSTDQFVRRFVRVECADWTMASFRFDESASLPGWVEKADVLERVAGILSRCAQAYATYAAVRVPAYATYAAVRVPAYATYAAVRDPAYATYAEVCVPAYATYAEVCDPAYATYAAVCDQAYATYAAVRDQALAAMIAEMATLPGYVGK